MCMCVCVWECECVKRMTHYSCWVTTLLIFLSSYVWDMHVLLVMTNSRLKYIYIYIYICQCICMYVRVSEKEIQAVCKALSHGWYVIFGWIPKFAQVISILLSIRIDWWWRRVNDFSLSGHHRCIICYIYLPSRERQGIIDAQSSYSVLTILEDCGLINIYIYYDERLGRGLGLISRQAHLTQGSKKKGKVESYWWSLWVLQLLPAEILHSPRTIDGSTEAMPGLSAAVLTSTLLALGTWAGACTTHKVGTETR